MIGHGISAAAKISNKESSSIVKCIFKYWILHSVIFVRQGKRV